MGHENLDRGTHQCGARAGHGETPEEGRGREQRMSDGFNSLDTYRSAFLILVVVLALSIASITALGMMIAKML
jgi:hypothetical protein